MHLWLQSNSFEVSSKSFEKKTIKVWCAKLIAKNSIFIPTIIYEKNLPIDFYTYSRIPNTRGDPNIIKALLGFFLIC